MINPQDLKSKEFEAIVKDVRKGPSLPKGLEKIAAQASQLNKSKNRVEQLKDEFKNFASKGLSATIPGADFLIKKAMDMGTGASSMYDATIEGLTEDMVGVKRILNSGIDELFGTTRAEQDKKDLKTLQDDFYSNPENGWAESAARFAGKYGPYMMPVGGGIGAATGVLKAGSYASKALGNPVSKFILNYAPTGAAMGMATADSDQSLMNAALWGAGLNMGAAPVAKIAEWAAPKIWAGGKEIVSKLFPNAYAKKLAKQTKISSKDIATAAESSPNGAMVGSTLELPNVNKFETNTLPALPGDLGAGVRDKMANIATGLMQQAEGIYKGLSNGLGRLKNGEELTKNIKDYFYNILQPQKQIMYDTFDQLASSMGVMVPLKEYKKTLQSLIDKYSKGKSQLGRKSNDALIKELQGMLDDSADVATTDIANIFKGEFRKDAASTDNMAAQDSYKQLGEALHKDLKNAIEESGSGALKNSYQAAESYYAQNIAPFLEGDLKKIISGEADKDSIAKRFLPNEERPALLQNIVENVPGIEKNLTTDFVKKTRVKNKFKEFITNPEALYARLVALGDDRLDMLVKDPALRQQISEFMDNMRVNGEVLQRLVNFKNGYANVSQQALINSAEFGASILDDIAKGDKLGLFSKLYAMGVGVNANKLLSDPEALKKLAILRAKYENIVQSDKVFTSKQAIDPMRRLFVVGANNIVGGEE